MYFLNTYSLREPKMYLEFWNVCIQHYWTLFSNILRDGVSVVVDIALVTEWWKSVLTYRTDAWAIKAENLHSLERTERMMVRWICGVSLKERKRSVDLYYSLLGIHILTDVVKRGRLRWFGRIGCGIVDDWVSVCRKVEVAGVKCVWRNRKTC